MARIFVLSRRVHAGLAQEKQILLTVEHNQSRGISTDYFFGAFENVGPRWGAVTDVTDGLHGNPKR
jgi:hypothetical protein